MDASLLLLVIRQVVTFISAAFWFDTFLRAQRAARRPWPFIYLTLTAATQFFVRLFIDYPGFAGSIFYDLNLTMACLFFLLAAYHMNRVWRHSEPPL